MRSGGRRSGLGRAFREHAQTQLGTGRGRGPTFDETLAGLGGELVDDFSSRLSRRDMLAAGGAVAGAFLLPSWAAGRPRPQAPQRQLARVVIVGAGLAGVAAAYQLHRVGVPARLYEARRRLGGRCWTAHGFADGQTAEHGGEFIDTRHVHIRQLAQQLGLQLDDLYAEPAGAYSPNWVGGRDLTASEIAPDMHRVVKAVTAQARRLGVIRPGGRITTAPISYPTATPAAVAFDRFSMADWLGQQLPGLAATRFGEWLDQLMSGWYGLNLSELSAVNLIDFFVVPAPGADERWHVHGGNDQIVHRAAASLPQSAIHVDRPLRAVRRRASGSYELAFDGTSRPVVADLVILTLPFTTLRDVDLRRADISAHKRAAIDHLAMGTDSKLLLQYDRRPAAVHDWSGVMTSSDPDFDTWESSATQAGNSGLITVYAGGRTSASWRAAHPHAPASRALRDMAVSRIDEAVPGSRAHFNGRAWADLWLYDPWTRGSYAAFGPRQYTRFWGGTAQAEGNLHFAGEATSAHSQGYLNGGVESGDRAAIEVMKKLGVRVPPSLARLPYTPA